MDSAAAPLIGVSSSKDQIQEFVDVNKFTSRSTWSNCNRGAMDTLATIYKDKSFWMISRKNGTITIR